MGVDRPDRTYTSHRQGSGPSWNLKVSGRQNSKTESTMPNTNIEPGRSPLSPKKLIFQPYNPSVSGASYPVSFREGMNFQWRAVCL